MVVNVEEKKEEWENIKKTVKKEEKELEREEDGDKKEDKKKDKKKKPSKQTQKKNEESELAVTINQLVYNFSSSRCATDKLKYEQVEEINIGGSVTNLINYYFPSWNINHPVITLIGRVLKFLKLFTKTCFDRRVKKEENKEKQRNISKEIINDINSHMEEYLESTK